MACIMFPMRLNIVVTNKIIFKGSIYSEKEIISIDIYESEETFNVIL